METAKTVTNNNKHIGYKLMDKPEPLVVRL